MESKEVEILKAAEVMIREGGYNAFSFREIAKEIGIKSSSVHYHFPTKADLGAAIAEYYTDNFLNYLGDPKELVAQGKSPIEVYIAAFRGALVNDKRMCLCGLLGAEINSLPPEVAAQTKIFFERNIAWLAQAYSLQSSENAKEQAMHTLALLEGAMIMSNVLKDIEVFDSATSHKITLI